MQTKIININQLTNSQCILSEDGEKVFAEIKKVLETEDKVVLSFKDINILTTAFLNSAIGNLYNDFREEYIKEKLSVENMKDEDKAMLKRVTDNAKNYYKNSGKISQSIKEILEED
ncbi:DUF4325 domain-containing protein [Campylobacter lari]|uniref:STAS-like domain-containing protein n=1 Tax=unclassified Campylobacter TaxID=2593542 RepID=UPI00128691BC|nr:MULTISPECIES: STAS-like domain-containing protein [unclassified Campylobacter]EAI7262555.1 DUF4325 domain-containing protein [Campylobacter lari]EAK0436250.1 DUF4325 domain-containing protein [Campylobacter lari]EAK0804793.1 DUF4325 domain-containing protein [Campylobacter lari]EAL9771806.1 DUF4325 domain-containing protein [Campylobacter lari]EGK7522534.1 STAS-like domain-containing protein [Campylobacter lari]